MLFPCCFGEQAGSFSQSLLLNSFHFGLKKGVEGENSAQFRPKGQLTSEYISFIGL